MRNYIIMAVSCQCRVPFVDGSYDTVYDGLDRDIAPMGRNMNSPGLKPRGETRGNKVGICAVPEGARMLWAVVNPRLSYSASSGHITWNTKKS
ncbi:hypothetical protein ACFL1X_03085 [Candidatus Hydrogenedentota bacterium]